MIKFIVECSNFIKAAEVEKCLKDKGILFKVETEGYHRGEAKPGKGGPRRKITPVDVKNILAFCATHSDYTDKEVADHFPCGSETIRRIRLGTHHLAKKVK